MINKNLYCSESARENNLNLVGTATYAEKIILIEYPKAFKANALEESDLPEYLKNSVADLKEKHTTLKCHLIKSSETSNSAFSIFGIDTSEKMIRRQVFYSYDELNDFNVNELFTGNRYIFNEKMFLICTNGKRDKCCAKYGLPVYKEFSKKLPGLSWQSSHLGGHRFAPTLLLLPNCISYGQVNINEVDIIIANENDNRIYLPKCRGIIDKANHLQAAEIFMRKNTNLNECNSIEIISDEKEDDLYKISIQNKQFNEIFKITMKQTELTFKNYLSCSDDQAKLTTEYRLESLEKNESEDL